MAPRFTFFGGKGGVGKTTCASAAAVRAAEEGRRVLVVSTDPAHSLGDALAVALGPEPRRVHGSLFAAQLDADRALGRWMRAHEEAFRTIAERGTYLDEDDVDRLLSLSLPGVDELVGLVELMRLAHARVWDEVVVDTAPTGHTVRLLEMPDTLRRVAEVFDDMHAKHRFLAASLGGGWRPDFADAAIADVEREAKEIRALLTDASRCSFTWITLPEALPIEESAFGVSAIERLGVRVGTVVVNRVWPAPDRPCALCSPRVEEERRWLARVVETFGARARLLVVPAAVAEPRGVRALAAFARSIRPLVLPDAPRRSSPRATRARRAAKPGASLALPRDVRLVLFGGKGGVGKTSAACAEAIVLASARPRDRVLLLSTDPAHSLADALDAELGDDPRRVPGAPPNLHARELDAKKGFDVEREKYRASIDELFASIFRGNMDASFDRQVLEDLLDLAPPGLDEVFALVGIADALVPARAGEASAYDVAIVDTAPTGHTLRLLALPPAALEWIHAVMAILLKYRHVVGLGDLASDLTTLARRVRELEALLADPARCAFVAVTRPAELPVLETARMLARLRALHVPLGAVLVNAVTPAEGCARCAAARDAEAPEIAELGRIAARRRAPAVVAAPAIWPPPRGARALERWRSEWHRV